MVLMPFWKYPDIWNKVDYPADLLEVLLNIALFMPIGLLLGGMGMKLKRVFLCGVVLSGSIEVWHQSNLAVISIEQQINSVKTPL